MRTIKTQDGKMIFNADRVLSVKLHKNNSKSYCLIVKIDLPGNWELLGSYSGESGEERALSVLNELDNWLMMDRSLHEGQVIYFFERGADSTPMLTKLLDFFYAYNNFQIPKDNDEEIKALMNNTKQ